MNRKLEKLESTYWKIGKIIGILFTIINYKMWTDPFNIVIPILLIIGVSVGVFVAINLIDLFLGVIIGVVKHIDRKIKDRRLLDGFCQMEAIGEKE